MPKPFDLTGRTIGRLHVLGPAPRGKDGPAWNTRCACGTEGAYSSQTLLSSNGRRSCGCGKRIDLVGQTFGMLEVVGVAPRIPRQQGTRWACRCSCGREHVARAKDLKTGNTTSCGCRINRLVVSRGEMTPRQLAALSAIARAPDGLRAVDLTPLLGIGLWGVQSNVRKLVRRGAVVRRRARVFILPAGVEVLYGRRRPAPAEHHAP